MEISSLNNFSPLKVQQLTTAIRGTSNNAPVNSVEVLSTSAGLSLTDRLTTLLGILQRILEVGSTRTSERYFTTPSNALPSDQIEKFKTVRMIETAAGFTPEGYTVVKDRGNNFSRIAIPDEEVGDFTSFLNSAGSSVGNLIGSQVGGTIGTAAGSVIGANPSQTTALQTVGSTFGSAAGGAAALSIASGAGVASAGSAALASAAAAWPAAVVIAAYSVFSNIKSMKAAAGGGRLTDNEIKVALDVFGVEKLIEKSTPKELTKLLPAELGGGALLRPGYRVGQVIAKNLFGSGKHADQIMRDRVRQHFEKIGLTQKIQGSHQVLLADGSTFDIGLDGRKTLFNTDGNTRPPYNIDWTNPFAHQVTGWTTGFVQSLLGGNTKAISDFTGYLVNAALSNADSLYKARENLISIFSTSNISAADVSSSLTNQLQAGIISEHEYTAQLAGFLDLLTNKA